MSTALVWREEALTRLHDREGFDCGVPALNEYLRRYARQNHDTGGAKTFVAVAPESPAIILGYYTISPGAIAFAKTPAAITRKLGRYEVPVFRLGRLAVSRSVQVADLAAIFCLQLANVRLQWRKKWVVWRSPSTPKTSARRLGTSVLVHCDCWMIL